jgi:hypothetical protein
VIHHVDPVRVLKSSHFPVDDKTPVAALWLEPPGRRRVQLRAQEFVVKPKEYIRTRVVDLSDGDIWGRREDLGNRQFVALPSQGDFIMIHEDDQPGSKSGYYNVVHIIWQQEVSKGSRVTVPVVCVTYQRKAFELLSK